MKAERMSHHLIGFLIYMTEYFSYTDQLKHPLWKKRRIEILKRDNFICKFCGKTADESMLNVHHRYYLSNVKAWEYDDIVLITLCDKCHLEEEEKLIHWSAVIVSTLRQFGGMSDQLIEFATYLIAIGNTETAIHILHDFLDKNKKPTKKLFQ